MRDFLVICAAMAASFQAAGEPAFRYSAPIVVTKPTTFVRVPLSAEAYARSESAGLADMRIIDARGERVPFAVLAPRQPETQRVEAQRDAALYPLPARPAPDGAWRMPVEVTVQDGRVTVKRLQSIAPPAARSAGWLFDLGENAPGEIPQSLHLAWRAPAEFNVGFRFETSEDLRQWRAGGSGQLMALTSPAGPLTQPLILLPSGAGRFVRLVWDGTNEVPQLTSAKVIAEQQQDRVLDPAVELLIAPSPEPRDKAGNEGTARALHFDLGGVLPVEQIDLRWNSGTRVAPVRVQARDNAGAAWRDLASAVFYRLEREGETATSPPLALSTRTRYLRVVLDERAATLDAVQTQLVVRAPLASLVFAAQGQPPYTLQAGAKVVGPSALPLATLVPALDTERERFGHATLGAWTEVEAVARAERAQEQRAALRPWLLWSVLVGGVAALAFMVWRLARGAPPSANR